MEKYSKKPSNLRHGARNGRQLSHCWSYELSDNTAHIGFTCKNKKDVYIDEATRRNKMDDNDKDHDKQEWWHASISTLLSTHSKRIKIRNSSATNNAYNANMDALTTTNQLIADTTATGYFTEMNASYLKNIKLVDSPISILYPSGPSIKSTHTTEFNFDEFPPH